MKDNHNTRKKGSNFLTKKTGTNDRDRHKNLVADW